MSQLIQLSAGDAHPTRHLLGPLRGAVPYCWVRKVKLHAVRHTLALIMHRAGQAPADAAALLGHTVAVHLSTYVPLTEKGARTAASGLGAALAGVV